MRIALVVLDTLRKDSFDEFFDWLPGLRFENAYSTSHWTVPAHASLFTGKYGSEIGVHSHHQTLDFDGTVLAEAASEKRYETIGLSSNPFVSQRYGWERGFDSFVGPSTLQSASEKGLDWDVFLRETDATGWKKYAEALQHCLSSDAPAASIRQGIRMARGYDRADRSCEAVTKWVNEATFSEDTFLFINLIEAHTPYHPPNEYRVVDEPVFVDVRHILEEPSDPKQIRRAYRSNVRYLADVYRDLFEALSEFDYVITVSDHGEMLGEHGMWNHVHGLYPELTRVPLVISGEGIDRTRETSVNLHDVHRTVADLAGLDVDSRGRNLLGDDLDSTRMFTEYRGLPLFSRNVLGELDVSQDVIDSYERDLYGVVGPSGYYGHRELSGFTEIGEADGFDPEAAIDEFAEELGSLDRSESDQEVSEEVMTQLKKLGYA